MPITFSHPALVLPFRYLPKRWFSLTGLIVGSMTPDFEYFIRLQDGSVYGHSWTGMFWYDLPMALLLAFIYHNVVKQQLLANMPGYFKRRLYIYHNFNWNRYFKSNFIVVIISVLVGVASHLIWDSFTHFNEFLVPGLNRQVIVMHRDMPLYLFLQYASSLVGAVILLVALMRLPEHTVPAKKTIIPYWLLVVCFSQAMIFLKRRFGISADFYTDTIICAISGMIVGLIMIPLLFKIPGPNSLNNKQ